MAKEIITRLIDDVDGGPAHETVDFGLDGTNYTIDLSSKNAKRLRSELAAFVDHGVKVKSVSSSTSRNREKTVHTATVREWAEKNGIEVAPRGRIKQEVVDAYHNRNR